MDNTLYFLVRELFTLKFWNLAQGTVRSPRWIVVAFPRGRKDVRRRDSSGKWECPALPAFSLQETDVLNGRQPSDLPSDSSVWDLLISYMFHHSYIHNVGKFLNVFQLKTLKKSPWSPPPWDMHPPWQRTPALLHGSSHETTRRYPMMLCSVLSSGLWTRHFFCLNVFASHQFPEFCKRVF